MRWICASAAAAILCVSVAAADDEFVYLRTPDPWTNTILRYTPAHNAIVPEPRVDYGRHVVILEELYHVYYAEWPKGCDTVSCATLRHKVQIGPRHRIDSDTIEITDQHGAELDRTRAVRYWLSARQRAGLTPLLQKPPASLAENHGLRKRPSMLAAQPKLPQLTQKAEQQK